MARGGSFKHGANHRCAGSSVAKSGSQDGDNDLHSLPSDYKSPWVSYKAIPDKNKISYKLTRMDIVNLLASLHEWLKDAHHQGLELRQLLIALEIAAEEVNQHLWDGGMKT